MFVIYLLIYFDVHVDDACEMDEKSPNVKEKKSRRMRKERFPKKQSQNWVGNIPPWTAAIRGPLIGGTVSFRGSRKEKEEEESWEQAFPRRGRQSRWTGRSNSSIYRAVSKAATAAAAVTFGGHINASSSTSEKMPV